MKFKREKTLLLILIFFLGVVTASNEMLVKINLIGYQEEYEVYLSVPDEINLGNITKDKPYAQSEKKYIYNNGTKKFNITVNLDKDYDPVFDYLYLKSYGDSTQYKVDKFIISVDKNDNRTFYVGINLTNFNKTYELNNLELNTTLIFNAIPA